MSIPDFQALMLPVLTVAGDCKDHTVSEVVETLAARLGLTNEDRTELLPSGRQPRFNNRIGWAQTYLKKAGLLESSNKGKFHITDSGIAALREKPQIIDTKYLERFPGYLAFKNKPASPSEPEAPERQTPEELIDAAVQTLQAKLSQDLLERIMRSKPVFFEQLVVELLTAMGYGGSRREAGQAVGQSGDGGIDGIIKEDRLGLDSIYIQAKRWEGSVGRPVVQAFVGSLEGEKARKGVLITTSQFSQDAMNYVRSIEKRVVLIDGGTLVRLMIEHGVGVTEAANFVINKVNEDYFDENG